ANVLNNPEIAFSCLAQKIQSQDQIIRCLFLELLMLVAFPKAVGISIPERPKLLLANISVSMLAFKKLNQKPIDE
ncbi:4478_t:CDS:2, partial [Funneliformis mosseae]